MNERSVLGIVAMLSVTLGAGNSVAVTLTPETKCQRARYKAMSDYEGCQYDVMSSGFAYPKALKCVAKHNVAWPKLGVKYPGTSCVGGRLIDNGDGTITDNLTRLVWVKKVAGDPLHDPDLTWRLSTDNAYEADGTAYTTFLAALNVPTCFVGHCDWRLPTFFELQTLLLVAPTCPIPCIDSIFGAGTDLTYWSASTQRLTTENDAAAWFVGMATGGMGGNDKKTAHPVFAVRSVGW